MEQLWITLPAIAPDYSGICSAMFDLGGMSIIHDASGCTGNYTGYDEPRWYGSNSMVFCSGLREIDAVLGRDDKLIDNIIKASEYTDPTCYSLIGSPVPMVIGSDMRGIACELENITGKPAFGFSSNGIELYNKGVSKAMMEVIKRFSKDKGEKVKGGINILGTTPIDFSANSNAEDIEKKLTENGYKVIAKMMMGASIEQIENLTKAEVNLVVAESGLDAAEYLYKKYGIPYVAGTFVGRDNDELLEMIKLSALDGGIRVLGQKERGAKDKRVLIVGEQILGNSLRASLEKRYPDIKADVATMSGLRKSLSNEGDIDITGEYHLASLIHSGDYKVIVGDPLFNDLIEDECNACLVEIPHVAISSKLYWNNYVRFASEETDNIIDEISSKF
ncbi:MAG: nitrogenase component 1 [Eubacterium sp.]|nr:nitrogenase component 1 [Eubacterium sp.]